MADAGDDPAQHDAHVAFRLIRRLADRVQIFPPRADIPPATEIGERNVSE
jgi:hypothetical protein